MPKPTDTASHDTYDHGADIGVRGIGSSKAIAFEQAAVAMTSVVADLATVSPEQPVSINCEGGDDEILFVDWLNALIYEMATRHMLFSRFEIDLKDSSLIATAWGENVDIERHQPAVEIKGATYTTLRVGRDEDGQWIAQTVVDV